MKRAVINNVFKKSATLFIALLLAFSPIRPSANVNAQAFENSTEPKSIYEHTVNTDAQDLYSDGYGYAMLSKEANGASMQKLYESIDTTVSKYADGGSDIPTDSPYSSDSGSVFYEIPNATFKGADYSLSIDEMVSVYFTYRADHPEAFFLPPSYLFSESLNTIYLIIPEDFVLQSERVKYTELAKKRLEDFKGSLDDGAGEYEIAIKAHDLLMEENFYRYDSGNIPSTKQSAHSIIGWLDQSGVVCEGYSKAFQYLLKGCDVECLYVTGASKGQAHAWNVVKCASSWFWVDITFDDQSNLPGGYYHYYFGLPNSAFLKDHTPGTRTFGSSYQVELPTIADDFNNFYYKKAEALISAGASSSELMKTLTDSAKIEFDKKNYTVTLFAENESAKTQAISDLSRASLVAQAIKDYNLSLRCSSKYTFSTVSSADAGNGGCIIYVNFSYHPCDVDRNTFVEKSDAELILDALCGNSRMPKYADADESGEVTVYDAVVVLKAIK